MDTITELHREATRLGVIDWARDIANVSAGPADWPEILTYVVTAHRLGYPTPPTRRPTVDASTATC